MCVAFINRLKFNFLPCGVNFVSLKLTLQVVLGVSLVTSVSEHCEVKNIRTNDAMMSIVIFDSHHVIYIFVYCKPDDTLQYKYNTNQIYNARKVTPKCESEVRIREQTSNHI